MSRLLGPPCCQELIHRGRRAEEGEPRMERAAIGRGPPPIGRDETRGVGEPRPAAQPRRPPTRESRSLAWNPSLQGRSHEQRRELWASSHSRDKRSGRRGATVDRQQEKPSCRPGTLACGGRVVNGEGSHGPPPVVEDVRGQREAVGSLRRMPT